MAYDSITEAQWRLMHGAPQITQNLIAKSSRVVSTLRSVFGEPEIFEGSGLRVELVDEADVVANLHTPLGPARLRRGWAIEDDALAGVLHVERLLKDQKGRAVWEPVWGIIIPQQGNPYGGSGDGRLHLLFDRQLGNHLRNSVFAAGMCMLFAIARARTT